MIFVARVPIMIREDDMILQRQDFDHWRVYFGSFIGNLSKQ